MGAGPSFGNEYVLTVDNVKTYEVVLCNGTIIHANATAHHALNGGDDNFSVITRYELITLNTPDRIREVRSVLTNPSYLRSRTSSTTTTSALQSTM